MKEISGFQAVEFLKARTGGMASIGNILGVRMDSTLPAFIRSRRISREGCGFLDWEPMPVQGRGRSSIAKGNLPDGVRRKVSRAAESIRLPRPGTALNGL